MYVSSVVYILLLVQYLVHNAPLNKSEEKCVVELKLNKSVVEAWNVEPILPVNNKEISDYMACYWKKMGYQKENGEIDYIKIGIVVHEDLKNRMHSNMQHVVAHIVNNCKNKLQANSDGLRAIQMWNCLNMYTEYLF